MRDYINDDLNFYTEPGQDLIDLQDLLYDGNITSETDNDDDELKLSIECNYYDIDKFKSKSFDETDTFSILHFLSYYLFSLITSFLYPHYIIVQ